MTKDRIPLVVGNWKMNGTLTQAAALAKRILKGLPPSPDVEVVLCPPFTALSTVAEIVKASPIALGAQNLHWELQGAFTGEISAPMLKEVGCRFSIVGHSERRHALGETDIVINKKILTIIKEGLRAILCVGETLPERKSKRTWEVVQSQLEADLNGVEGSRLNRQVVIAYEPVWAIGTGANATGIQAEEVHGQIRSWLTKRFGGTETDAVRILYGGSVKPENASEILNKPNVDGALVGGASLDPKAFLSIVESTLRAKGSPCCTG